MQARFAAASDQSLLIYLGDTISLEVHSHVIKLLRALQSQPIPGVRNFHPAYCSLLVKFDPLELGHDGLQSIIQSRMQQADQAAIAAGRSIEIPVRYGGEFGPDLDDVAAANGITASQAIELHASAEYVVYFLGFAPGFAYLGGLPEALTTPRLPVPRRSVPPGSVGIGGNQTGVYPFAMPGGWRLIGRTPLSMFDPERTDMSLLRIGDRLRFTPLQP
jgi:KipI family sensor histidine kinase inhibitor